jgi:hypothetical protein
MERMPVKVETLMTCPTCEGYACRIIKTRRHLRYYLCANPDCRQRWKTHILNPKPKISNSVYIADRASCI